MKLTNITIPDNMYAEDNLRCVIEFSEKSLYSLDFTLAYIISNGLEQFKNQYPEPEDMEIDDIIKGFEDYANGIQDKEFLKETLPKFIELFPKLWY